MNSASASSELRTEGKRSSFGRGSSPTFSSESSSRKRFPSRPLRLPADIEAHIDAFYGESNARLAAMRRLPLAALDYPLAALGYPLTDVQEADCGEGLAKDAA